MKRKFLLFISAVSVILCLLAIGACAETFTYNGEEIEITRGYTKEELLADETLFKSFASKCNNGSLTSDLELILDDSSYAVIMGEDGELYAVPSYYIIELSGTGDDTIGVYIAVSEINYSYVNELITGTSFSKGAIRYIAFPEGMTRMRANAVFGVKTNSTPYETNVTDMVFPSTTLAVESQSFNSMPNLKSIYVKPGNKITSIPSSTFSNSTLEYFSFENLTELTTVDGFTGTNLTGDLDLSKTKLTVISAGCFQGNVNIGKITLPDCLETIADQAFENCGSAYLSSPYLPSSLKSIGKRFFSYNDNLNETYIFPTGITSLGEEAFQDSKRADGPSGKSLNLVFLGEVTGVIYLNGGGHQYHAETVTVYFAQNSYSQYNSDGFYIKPSQSSVTSVPGAIRVVFCAGDGAVELTYLTSTSGSSYTDDMADTEENGFDMANHTHYTPTEITCENADECIVCDVLQQTLPHDVVSDGDCTTDDFCSMCKECQVAANADHNQKIISIVIKTDTQASAKRQYAVKTMDVLQLTMTYAKRRSFSQRSDIL